MKKLWAITGRVMFVLAWPALYLLFKGTKRTRIIVSCGDNVLFVKDWLGDGSWKLPGGGVRKSENVELAAVRELKEETGIELSAPDLSNVGVIKIDESEMPYYCYAFSAKVPSTNLKTKKHKMEISDIAWLNVNKSNEQNISNATRQLLRLWRQQS